MLLASQVLFPKVKPKQCEWVNGTTHQRKHSKWIFGWTVPFPGKKTLERLPVYFPAFLVLTAEVRSDASRLISSHECEIITPLP